MEDSLQSPRSRSQQNVTFAALDRPGGYQNAIDTFMHESYVPIGGETPRTKLELDLCELIGAIRDRKQWWEKIKDPVIVAKWRDEVDENGKDKFEYALKECQWFAEKYQGPARPAAADGVFCVDDVNDEILGRLKEGVSNVRDSGPRDVHPDSDGFVVDIVHPSMYAYEQGVTPVLGGADVYEMPAWKEFMLTQKGSLEEAPMNINERMCSKAGLQWLPAEFYVPTGREKCRINSYINSLHPVKHTALYDAIGDAFLQAMPLLEEVLSLLGTPERPRQHPLRISGGVIRMDLSSDEDEQHEEDEDYDSDEYWAKRPLIEPTIPKEFVPPPEYNRVSLIGKRLQVIVKISSIELTPEQQSYPGGSWHVEGMRNERIVATACMYMENDNCTESILEFRVAIAEPTEYEQCDYAGVEKIYALQNDMPLVQPRAASRTLPGRILAWPNTLQHRVRPFELANKTKSGKRTILCFFLVDPTLRIRSTATVPPQCREWLNEGLAHIFPSALPKEVSAQVCNHIYGMSYEDACKRRERLMSERKKLVKSKYDEVFYERPCSLCEH